MNGKEIKELELKNNKTIEKYLLIRQHRKLIEEGLCIYTLYEDLVKKEKQLKKEIDGFVKKEPASNDNKLGYFRIRYEYIVKKLRGVDDEYKEYEGKQTRKYREYKKELEKERLDLEKKKKGLEKEIERLL